MNHMPSFHPERKFVRVIETHDNGLVEFEFAVGEPGLFVEMLLPQTAFDEFCLMHKVTPTLGPLSTSQDSDEQEWEWSLRAAREQRPRQLS